MGTSVWSLASGYQFGKPIWFTKSLVNTTCISWVCRYEREKKKTTNKSFSCHCGINSEKQPQWTEPSAGDSNITSEEAGDRSPKLHPVCPRTAQGSSLGTAAMPWLFAQTQSQGTPNTKCVTTVMLQNPVTLHLLIWAKYSVLQKPVKDKEIPKGKPQSNSKIPFKSCHALRFWCKPLSVSYFWCTASSPILWDTLKLFNQWKSKGKGFPSSCSCLGYDIFAIKYGLESLHLHREQVFHTSSCKIIERGFIKTWTNS